MFLSLEPAVAIFAGKVLCRVRDERWFSSARLGQGASPQDRRGQLRGRGRDGDLRVGEERRVDGAAQAQVVVRAAEKAEGGRHGARRGGQAREGVVDELERVHNVVGAEGRRRAPLLEDARARPARRVRRARRRRRRRGALRRRLQQRLQLLQRNPVQRLRGRAALLRRLLPHLAAPPRHLRPQRLVAVHHGRQPAQPRQPGALVTHTIHITHTESLYTAHLAATLCSLLYRTPTPLQLLSVIYTSTYLLIKRCVCLHRLPLSSICRALSTLLPLVLHHLCKL